VLIKNELTRQIGFREKPGGIVERFELTCPLMLRIRMLGEWESKRQLANSGLPGK